MSRPVEVAGTGVEQQMQDEHWGRRLREIREASNISLEEVVAELRLEPRLVQQIEAEELDQLPSAPFVKGYLRNYARMLNVDAVPILEAYGRVGGADAPGLTYVSRVRELSSRDRAPRSTTWIIVAVVVVSVLVWWWSHLISFKKTAEEAVAPGQEQSSAPAAASSDGSSDAMIELALPEQPQSQPQTESQPPTATTATAPAVASTAPNPATITLKFSQESWVDISDATGARLFVEMARANESRTVTGTAPFKVMLGNAPAVTMEYNGAPYDLRAHASKGGMARFTLGEPAATGPAQ